MRMVKGGWYILDDVEGYRKYSESNHKMLKIFTRPFRVASVETLGVSAVSKLDHTPIKNPRTMRLMIGNSEMRFFKECPSDFEVGCYYKLTRRSEFVEEGGMLNKAIAKRYLSGYIRVDAVDPNGNVSALTSYSDDGIMTKQKTTDSPFIKRFVMCYERWMFDEVVLSNDTPEDNLTVDIDSMVKYHSDLKKRYRELTAQRDKIDEELKSVADKIRQVKFDINSEYGRIGHRINELMGEE